MEFGSKVRIATVRESSGKIGFIQGQVMDSWPE